MYFFFFFFVNQKWLVDSTNRKKGHMTSDDNVHQINVWVTSAGAKTLLLQLSRVTTGNNHSLDHDCGHLQDKEESLGEANL